MQYTTQNFEYYLKNKKLMFIYDELKKNGIKVVPMYQTEKISKDAVCRTSSIDLENNIWGMSVINNVEVNDSVLCHELAHLIMFYEGFPLVVPVDDLESYWEGTIISFLFNLTAHLEVWRLTSLYGFPEKERYDDEVRGKLIDQIQRNVSFWESLTPQMPIHEVEKRILQAAIYIAGGIVCPCHDETKKILWESATEHFPKAVPLAHRLVQICHNALPLSPESSLRCLAELIAPLHPPMGCLMPVYPKKLFPNLRESIALDISAL